MSEGTPYVGFSNETLEQLPPLKAGDEIECPRCGGRHPAEGTTDPETGEAGDTLLFYHCGPRMYLAGVEGKNVVHLRADSERPWQPGFDGRARWEDA